MAQDFLPARYDWGEVVTAPVSVEGARDAADVDCLSVLSNCPLNCGQTAPENIDKVHKNTIEGTVYSSPLHLFVGEFFNYSYNMDQKKAPNAVDPNTHPLVCLSVCLSVCLYLHTFLLACMCHTFHVPLCACVFACVHA